MNLLKFILFVIHIKCIIKKIFTNYIKYLIILFIISNNIVIMIINGYDV